MFGPCRFFGFRHGRDGELQEHALGCAKPKAGQPAPPRGIVHRPSRSCLLIVIGTSFQAHEHDLQLSALTYPPQTALQRCRNHLVGHRNAPSPQEPLAQSRGLMAIGSGPEESDPAFASMQHGQPPQNHQAAISLPSWPTLKIHVPMPREMMVRHHDLRHLRISRTCAPPMRRLRPNSVAS